MTCWPPQGTGFRCSRLTGDRRLCFCLWWVVVSALTTRCDLVSEFARYVSYCYAVLNALIREMFDMTVCSNSVLLRWLEQFNALSVRLFVSNVCMCVWRRSRTHISSVPY